MDRAIIEGLAGESLTNKTIEPPAKTRPKYVLEVAEVLTDQAKDNLRRSLDGVFQPGEVIVLEQGVKIRPIDGKPQDELVKAHKLHRALRQQGELGYSVDGPESVMWTGRGMVYEKVPVTAEGRAGRAMPLLLPGEIDVLLDTAAWVGNAMRGTQAWKLALATAAVWTLALFTAGYRAGVM